MHDSCECLESDSSCFSMLDEPHAKETTHRCLKTQNDPVDPIKRFRLTLTWTQVLHAGRQNQLPWFFIWFYVLHFYSFFMLIHKTRTPWYEWTPLMSFSKEKHLRAEWLCDWSEYCISRLYFQFWMLIFRSQVLFLVFGENKLRFVSAFV